MSIYWTDFAEASLSLTQTTSDFAILGAPRRMISKKWKSVKLSITIGFLCKLIQRCSLANAGHQTWFTFRNFQIQCLITRTITPNVNKLTVELTFLAIIELQRWGSRGSPRTATSFIKLFQSSCH